MSLEKFKHELDHFIETGNASEELLELINTNQEVQTYIEDALKNDPIHHLFKTIYVDGFTQDDIVGAGKQVSFKELFDVPKGFKFGWAPLPQIEEKIFPDIQIVCTQGKRIISWNISGEEIFEHFNNGIKIDLSEKESSYGITRTK